MNKQAYTAGEISKQCFLLRRKAKKERLHFLAHLLDIAALQALEDEIEARGLEKPGRLDGLERRLQKASKEAKPAHA